MRTGVIDTSDARIFMEKLGENGYIDGIVNNGGVAEECKLCDQLRKRTGEKGVHLKRNLHAFHM
jgi:hypothetical protein